MLQKPCSFHFPAVLQVNKDIPCHSLNLINKLEAKL